MSHILKIIVEALNGTGNAIENEHGEVQLYVRADLLIRNLEKAMEDEYEAYERAKCKANHHVEYKPTGDGLTVTVVEQVCEPCSKYHSPKSL